MPCPGQFGYKKSTVLICTMLHLTYYLFLYRKGTAYAVPFLGIWQAWHSPASLGFPLSYHRRVVATKLTTSNTLFYARNKSVPFFKVHGVINNVVLLVISFGSLYRGIPTETTL